MFKIIAKDNETRARTGILKTPHGVVKTPAYAIVATYGQIKNLKPSDIKRAKTQIIIGNTYHLWEETRPLTKILGIKMPTMTDSGGFQVFSLAFGEKRKVGKIMRENTKLGEVPEREKARIKITNKGVLFSFGGRKRMLTPELSMKIQKKLGADIIFAFDEPTSPHDSFKYNERALRRTHYWARKCLKVYAPSQLLSELCKAEYTNLYGLKALNSLVLCLLTVSESAGRIPKNRLIKF